MRELELDDIAIPCLGVLDLFVVRQAEATLDLADAQLEHLDGLGVAHRDDPAAFDFLHLLLREPLVGPLLERPCGRLICLGLVHAPSFLRAICSIPLFGIAKVAANVCSPDTNKNANKPDGCGELLRVFSTRHENFSENMESNQ